jgi:N-acetylmuramoyl-L-alanine amidase
MRQIIFLIIVVFLSHNQFALPDSFAQEKKRNYQLIVVDPGFGGEDKGPESCEKGIYGKEINLQIAEKLAWKIENTLNIRTILTRHIDQSLSLEERVSLANDSKADLMISIHTNGHMNSRTQGIETYKMKVLLDESSKSAGATDDSKFGIQNTESELGEKLVSLMITERNQLTL